METKAKTKRVNLFMLISKYSINPEDAHVLQSKARSLHRLAEHACNYGLTDRQEKRDDRLYAEAEELLASYGLHTFNQSDPRGWPLLIDHNPIADNETSMPDRICPY